MKYWQCPSCGRQWYHVDSKDRIVMKICEDCQVEVKLIDEETKEAFY